jgi:hypothetical protein
VCGWLWGQPLARNVPLRPPETSSQRLLQGLIFFFFFFKVRQAGLTREDRITWFIMQLRRPRAHVLQLAAQACLALSTPPACVKQGRGWSPPMAAFTLCALFIAHSETLADFEPLSRIARLRTVAKCAKWRRVLAAWRWGVWRSNQQCTPPAWMVL